MPVKPVFIGSTGTSYPAKWPIGQIVYKGQKFDESILENKRGDVNEDGVVNISDVTTLIEILLKR